MDVVRTSIAALMVALCACDSGGPPAGSGGATSGGSTIAGSTTSGTTTASSGGATASGGAGGGGQGGATGGCASCAGACVDLQNDAQNCGGCGVVCPAKQHCDRGRCASPLCLVQGAICPGDHLCCGDACCPSWKICCNVPGGGAPACVPVDAGACPTSCAGCG